LASVNGKDSEGSWFGCSKRERLLKLKSASLSDYPERRRQSKGAGRITVDAREKDKLMVKMPLVTL
jgi:hypothetical protein